MIGKLIMYAGAMVILWALIATYDRVKDIHRILVAQDRARKGGQS